MGSLDDARAASATFRQQIEQCVGQIQGAGQGIVVAQQGFRGRLGNTSDDKVVEVEGRCQEAKKKLTEAIGLLIAANEAADQFAASLH